MKEELQAMALAEKETRKAWAVQLRKEKKQMEADAAFEKICAARENPGMMDEDMRLWAVHHHLSPLNLRDEWAIDHTYRVENHMTAGYAHTAHRCATLRRQMVAKRIKERERKKLREKKTKEREARQVNFESTILRAVEHARSAVDEKVYLAPARTRAEIMRRDAEAQQAMAGAAFISLLAASQVTKVSALAMVEAKELARIEAERQRQLKRMACPSAHMRAAWGMEDAQREVEDLERGLMRASDTETRIMNMRIAAAAEESVRLARMSARNSSKAAWDAVKWVRAVIVDPLKYVASRVAIAEERKAKQEILKQQQEEERLSLKAQFEREARMKKEKLKAERLEEAKRRAAAQLILDTQEEKLWIYQQRQRQFKGEKRRLLKQDWFAFAIKLSTITMFVV